MIAAEYLVTMNEEDFAEYVAWFKPEAGELVFGICHTEYGPITAGMVTAEQRRRMTEMLGF